MASILLLHLPLLALPLALRWLGVVDGLALASITSGCALAATQYAWARAVGGRVAGLVAVVSSLALASVVLLPRSLTLYPEKAACMALFGLGVTLAFGRRDPLGFAAAGLGMGLALLVDYQGLVFALLGLAACAPLCLWRARLPQVAGRLAALLLPLALSWAVAAHLHGELRPQTIDDRVGRVMSDVTGRRNLPLPPSGEGFLWGRSDPRGVPATVRTLRRLTTTEPDPVALRELPSNHPLHPREQQRYREGEVRPLLGVLVGAAILTAVGLRRRPWWLLGLLAGSAPFAVSLWSSYHLQIQLRHLMVGLAPLPVVMGLAFAALAEGRAPGGWSGVPLRWRPPLRATLAVGLCVAIVTGAAPSILAPGASWRLEHHAATEIVETWNRVRAGREAPRRGGLGSDPTNGWGLCYEGLGRDLAARGEADPRVFGWRPAPPPPPRGPSRQEAPPPP